MTAVRRLARPLLAATFISSGIDAIRNPGANYPADDGVTRSTAGQLPFLPEDPETLVRINGAVQVGAGLLLAIGRLPRLSSTLLAGSIIPTTLAGHRFWEVEDPGKGAARIHFLKNLGLLGGLMLSAVDTEGRPGLAWRAQHASHHVADSSRHARKVARLEAKLASRSARGRLTS